MITPNVRFEGQYNRAEHIDVIWVCHLEGATGQAPVESILETLLLTTGYAFWSHTARSGAVEPSLSW